MTTEQVVTGLFLLDGACLVGAAILQLIAIWKSKAAQEHSLLAWSYWTFSTFVGTVYAVFVNKAPPLIVVVSMLCLANVITVMAIICRRAAPRI